MNYLIEKDFGGVFHIDLRASGNEEQIVNALKEKKYVHKLIWKFKYMGKHDYFYLDCGIVLDISYANKTLRTLLNSDLSEYKFEFNLNPFSD
jgi:hypothetical protein